ncbi:MAG: helix-turn-helix domain-containing protein [Solirubrobacteraceae bacterium]
MPTILDAFSEDDLDALAALLAPRMPQPAAEEPSGWLDVTAAAEYLACKPARIYALTSARRIPFTKDCSRLLFNRRELDRWLADGGGRRP